MTKEQILEDYPTDELLFADGFDDCIIGITFEGDNVIYNVGSVIAKLQEQGMTKLEAYKYFEFNMLGTYVGEHTPLWVSM